MKNQPDWVRMVYALNPMVGVVEGFRWAILGVGEAPGTVMIPSIGMVVVLLIGGMYYFRRLERTFADLV
jgi:lipopolysaccharide transport system permease protein